MPAQESGRSQLPLVIQVPLRAVYGHPLVVWELLESDEGVEDLLSSVKPSDMDVEAACRQALRKLRTSGAAAKRVAYQQEAHHLRSRKSDLAATYAGSEDPEVLEQKDRARWQGVLAEYIEGAGLPVLQLAQSSLRQFRLGPGCLEIVGPRRRGLGGFFTFGSHKSRDWSGLRLCWTSQIIWSPARPTCQKVLQHSSCRWRSRGLTERADHRVCSERSRGPPSHPWRRRCRPGDGD